VSTIEIVANCIIVSLAVGVIAGVVWTNWYWLEPLRRERDKYRTRAIRAEAELRQVHRGTPYTAETLLAARVFDDHNASRRARRLEVVR
jgi:hypothetical protein